MNTAKKEADTSKYKPKIASAGIKSFMAAKGEDALATEIAGSLNEFKQEQNAENQQEQAAEKKQAQQLAQQQQQQNVVKQVETRQINQKIKSIKSKIPTRSKLLIALFIGIVYDAVDFVLTIVGILTAGTTLVATESIEWMADIPMQALFIYLLGPYYQRSRPLELIKLNFLKGVPGPMLEFIPVFDVLPLYTLSVMWTWRKIKEEHGEIKELEKEKKMLAGGGTAEAGFLGVSERKWGMILGVFAIAGFTALQIAELPGLITVAVVLMAYIVWRLFMYEETRSIAISIFFVALVLGGTMGILYFYVADYAAEWGGGVGEWGDETVTFREEGILWIKENNPITLLQNYYKKQILIATGDYYTGKVDENSKSKLGVYLEDLKQADPIIYRDRPLIMYANMKVLTLDEPVNVSLYCKTDGLEGTKPQLFPTDKFIVDTYEEQEIDCMFEPYSVKKGAWAFEIGADFNFKTLSYVKSYFMDADRLRGLRSEEIDPLEQYGIKDTRPESIYTVGPVGIGMSVGKPPVGLDPNQEQSIITIGITLNNLWDGSITKVNRFILILPKGFTLEEMGGIEVTRVECSSLPEKEQELCSDEHNTIYIVSDPSFVEVEKGDFKSYRGFMKINKGDFKNILGLTPVSTKYFKATVDYTYRLKETKIINVKTRQVRSLIADTSSMDVVGPTIQNLKHEKISDTSVTFRWETDEESNDLFKWWDVTKAPPVYTANTAPAETGYTASHSLTVEGLSTSKTYGYEISAADKSGNLNTKKGIFNVTQLK